MRKILQIVCVWWLALKDSRRFPLLSIVHVRLEIRLGKAMVGEAQLQMDAFG